MGVEDRAEPPDNQGEGRKLTGLPLPKRPTPREWGERMLTRIPFRSWRRCCEGGKAVNPSQHKPKEEDQESQ